MKKHSMVALCLGLLLLLYIAVVHAGTIKPTVLFDQGHGQKFVIEKEGELQLSGLSEVFRKKGFDVAANPGRLTDAALKNTDVLVVSGAFQPFAAEEIDAVMRFIERGGKLCVMLHIPQPLTGVMSRFKVYASNGVIQEQENVIQNSPKDFFLIQMENHALTKGLKKIGVHGSWALMTEGETAKIIARTGPKAWIDLNRDGKFNETDARQSFGVIIAGTLGKGKYVVFGDDAIFQNKFLEKENMVLGENLADWMK